MIENIKKIGFISIGLIGGSIARSLHDKLPQAELIAFDRHEDNMVPALDDGVISKGILEFDGSFYEGCDVIFLCTTVLNSKPYLDALTGHLSPDTILTDVGSVKGEIFSLIRGSELEVNFVGGHPMAGTEKFGYVNSFPELLIGANYVLTPSEKVSSDKVLRLKELVELMGSKTMILTPERHDLCAAAISHVPHVLSYSLANMIRQEDDTDNAMRLMAAGGLRDMTRIASSAPKMWEQICLANKDNVVTLLDEYISIISNIRDIIAREDGEALRNEFAKGKAYRDTL